MPDHVKTYTVSVKSVQEMVYRTLRDEILSMRLKPGTPISTQETAERLGVSRTPVREAFIRLQSESLLLITPQKVTKVAPISPQRVYQEKFIRESLEIECLSGFIPMANEEILLRQKQNVALQRRAMEEERYLDFIELDNTFHQLPFTVSGQTLGLEIIRQMNGHYDRMRLITAWDGGIARNAIEEHDRLIEYIERRDTGRAVELLRAHLRQLTLKEEHLKKNWADYFDER